MATDYHGKSEKPKDDPSKPEKKIEKIVMGEVIVKKKPIGRKIKDAIVEADFGGFAGMVYREMIIPGIKDMIWNVGSRTLEHNIYGPQGSRRRSILGSGPSGGTRFSYNTPVNRTGAFPGSRDPRMAPSIEAGPRRSSRNDEGDILISSREDATMVLDQMQTIIDQYDAVSVADLYDMLGRTPSHTDNKWGWVYIGDAQVRQTRDGYRLDLPPVEALST